MSLYPESHVGRNENNIDFSYEDHPIDHIEPLECPEGIGADVIRALMLQVFPPPGSGQHDNKVNIPELTRYRMQAAFRSFVAASLLIAPEVANPDGQSQRAIAEMLGITKAALSKRMVEWSKQLGVLGAGMRSPAARESYRQSTTGHSRCKGTKKSRALHVGERKVDAASVERDEAGIEKALAALRSGSRTWTLQDRRVLLAAGLIDGTSRLTAEGKARLANPWGETALPTPHGWGPP